MYGRYPDYRPGVVHCIYLRCKLCYPGMSASVSRIRSCGVLMTGVAPYLPAKCPIRHQRRDPLRAHSDAYTGMVLRAGGGLAGSIIYAGGGFGGQSSLTLSRFLNINCFYQ